MTGVQTCALPIWGFGESFVVVLLFSSRLWSVSDDERLDCGSAATDDSGRDAGERERSYLFHDAHLTRLTSDHSLVAELVRSGELTEEDAREHPQRNILTRAVGVGPEVEPAVAVAEPAPGDRLLLCSDGLFNELADDEITSVLASVPDPALAADELVRLAKDHGGADNITVVVLDVG